MDDETRTAIADLAETVRTGFARMDRYFELQQAQYLAFRAEMRGEVAGVRADLKEVRAELAEQARAAIEVRLEIEPDATVREELALALGR